MECESRKLSPEGRAPFLQVSHRLSQPLSERSGFWDWRDRRPRRFQVISTDKIVSTIVFFFNPRGCTQEKNRNVFLQSGKLQNYKFFFNRNEVNKGNEKRLKLISWQKKLIRLRTFLHCVFAFSTSFTGHKFVKRYLNLFFLNSRSCWWLEGFPFG